MTTYADRRRGEGGQVLAIFVLVLVVLIGMAGLAIDVGSWYRADRQAQTIADAATLAGAQALPGDPANAPALAEEYADKNGGAEATKTVSLSATHEPNDTITVEVEAPAPAFFTRLFGLDSVSVHARASALVGTVSSLRGVAPMVVHYQHEMLNPETCGSPPCTDPTTLPYDKDLTGAAGAFGMVNLDQGQSGTVGADVLADWIEYGFDDYLGTGEYRSGPGSKFSSGDEVRYALEQRIGTVLYFPVYDTLTLQGQNAIYNIIGFAGFYLEGFEIHGNEAILYGHFTGDYVDGLLSTGGVPDFGLRTIRLVE